MGKGSRAKANKAGRKRKATNNRMPSGRINQRRQAFEEGPQQVVLSARRRHHRGVRSIDADKRPVTKEQAKALRLTDRGSFLGNLMADGKLTAEQVEAGENYCQRYIAYAVLNGLPKITPQIAGYGAVRGMSRVERLDAAMAAKAVYSADQSRLRHCSAGVRQAIKRACVLDEPAPVHLVREGLDALLYAK